uniref:Uncharacterized protein n=1 Tax=Faecalibaculum rodentium TaxID=1702221 RepID=A0A140DY75_9FIRM|nr:hypothetical protein AALO17_24680 [Faecalibaculum rodentium]
MWLDAFVAGASGLGRLSLSVTCHCTRWRFTGGCRCSA